MNVVFGYEQPYRSPQEYSENAHESQSSPPADQLRGCHDGACRKQGAERSAGGDDRAVQGVFPCWHGSRKDLIGRHVAGKRQPDEEAASYSRHQAVAQREYYAERAGQNLVCRQSFPAPENVGKHAGRDLRDGIAQHSCRADQAEARSIQRKSFHKVRRQNGWINPLKEAERVTDAERHQDEERIGKLFHGYHNIAVCKYSRTDLEVVLPRESPAEDNHAMPSQYTRQDLPWSGRAPPHRIPWDRAAPACSRSWALCRPAARCAPWHSLS